MTDPVLGDHVLASGIPTWDTVLLRDGSRPEAGLTRGYPHTSPIAHGQCVAVFRALTVKIYK